MMIYVYVCKYGSISNNNDVYIMTFFTRFSLHCQNISTMFATFVIGIFESLRKPSQTHIIPISH